MGYRVRNSNKKVKHKRAPNVAKQYETHLPLIMHTLPLEPKVLCLATPEVTFASLESDIDCIKRTEKD